MCYDSYLSCGRRPQEDFKWYEVSAQNIIKILVQPDTPTLKSFKKSHKAGVVAGHQPQT